MATQRMQEDLSEAEQARIAAEQQQDERLDAMEQSIENIQLTPGPQGIQGVAGPKGDAGSAGQTGTAGSVGATGATGSQGQKGDKGDSGSAGVAGPAGVQGPKGDSGSVGATGPQGATGAQGPAGTNATPNLKATVNKAMPLIALGGLYQFDVTVSGATVGMVATVNPDSTTSDLLTSYRAAVISANTVRVYLAAGVLIAAGTRTFYINVAQ